MTPQTDIRTFLIADIRGYSRFTDEHGDEAAARLANRFAELVGEEVQAHGGELVELRGDEALAVFTSARQAIRTAVDLQALFDEEPEAQDGTLTVGIGIDSGEAVQLPDGSFRGSALNIAARLCGRARGGEVLVSEATSRLAGRLDGVHYSDRGRVHLKNIADPVHVIRVYSDREAPPTDGWRVRIFGRPGRSLGWRLAAAVVLVAAATAAAVVYLTAGDHPQPSGAATTPTDTGGGLPSNRPLAANAGLEQLVPAALWQDCKTQAVPEQDATETAVCLPAGGTPDRWEISEYPNGEALGAAYAAEIGRHPDIKRDTGKCNAFFWGGEYQWLHGPGKPGGHVFCYFEGDDAVVVWTHERLGQATHRDVLVIAREAGNDHAALTRWWRPWHHRIGKAE